MASSGATPLGACLTAASRQAPSASLTTVKVPSAGQWPKQLLCFLCGFCPGEFPGHKPSLAVNCLLLAGGRWLVIRTLLYLHPSTWSSISSYVYRRAIAGTSWLAACFGSALGWCQLVMQWLNSWGSRLDSSCWGSMGCGAYADMRAMLWLLCRLASGRQFPCLFEV